jgi:hypothetical protein
MRQDFKHQISRLNGSWTGAEGWRNATIDDGAFLDLFSIGAIRGTRSIPAVVTGTLSKIKKVTIPSISMLATACLPAKGIR